MLFLLMKTKTEIFILSLEHKDNINVRVLEQLTYTLASYEAWESLNQRTVFYYTLEEDYYQKHKEKFVRLELEEHDGMHVYYKYNPAWKTT